MRGCSAIGEPPAAAAASPAPHTPPSGPKPPLQAANVGDSAALFIDPEAGRAVELTEDHRLTNPGERQRLQDMGIQVRAAFHFCHGFLVLFCSVFFERGRRKGETESREGAGSLRVRAWGKPVRAGSPPAAALVPLVRASGCTAAPPACLSRLTQTGVPARVPARPPQLASNARRLYGLNLCRGLGDKFLKDEDLGARPPPHTHCTRLHTRDMAACMLTCLLPHAFAPGHDCAWPSCTCPAVLLAAPSRLASWLVMGCGAAAVAGASCHPAVTLRRDPGLCPPARLPVAAPAGLSAEPYVSPVVRLSEEQGGILLIASDGLWDVADADAVTAAICQADRCGAGGACARAASHPSACSLHLAQAHSHKLAARCNVALCTLPWPSSSLCRDKDGNVLESTNAVIAHALKQRTKDDVTGGAGGGCRCGATGMLLRAAWPEGCRARSQLSQSLLLMPAPRHGSAPLPCSAGCARVARQRVGAALAHQKLGRRPGSGFCQLTRSPRPMY
jgi:serine/threonine protein phosphatase PrpC